MTMNRRGFLAGIFAAAAAPVIIRTAGLLMPIKPALIGDGVPLFSMAHPPLIDIDGLDEGDFVAMRAAPGGCELAFIRAGKIVWEAGDTDPLAWIDKVQSGSGNDGVTKALDAIDHTGELLDAYGLKPMELGKPYEGSQRIQIGRRWLT